MLAVDKKSGFTLLELIVVVAIIGGLAAISIPQFMRRAQPRYQRTQFVARFDALLNFAMQQALMTQKVHAVSVDFGKRVISVSVETQERDPNKKTGDFIFQPVVGAYISSELIIPENLELKSVYIEGKDALGRAPRDKAEFWFFIVPEGLAQDIIINMIDKNDLANGKSRPVGLVLNPFLVQLREYDSFQKP